MSVDPSTSCPVPHPPPADRILLAHGEGARLTRRPIRDEILAAFDNPHLRPLGDRGLAVLAAREGLLEDSDLASDTAPLHGLVADLLASGADVHFLRDPTRGGLSAILHELAEAAGVAVCVEESAVPLTPAVRGA